MTAFALPSHHYPLLQRRNTGASKCSDELYNKVQDVIIHLREPITGHVRENLHIVLNNIYLECSKVNWDQYGANPISESVLTEAHWLLSALPSWVPNPEVVPEPSGEIGLEWDYGKDRIFVITINGDHSIAYAGFLGAGNRIRGIESYSEAIPSVIIEGIKRVSS